jgi:hypothetical protein
MNSDFVLPSPSNDVQCRQDWAAFSNGAKEDAGFATSLLWRRLTLPALQPAIIVFTHERTFSNITAFLYHNGGLVFFPVSLPGTRHSESHEK